MADSPPTGSQDRSVDRLTESQKACLRLFYERLSAKEIGRELGITPSTVHYHLTMARKTLDFPTSMEAARWLVRTERGPDYDPVLVDAMPIVAVPPDEPTSWLSRLPWPVPTRRRLKNDLSSTERLVAIGGIAILFMGVVGFYLLALKLFNESF